MEEKEYKIAYIRRISGYAYVKATSKAEAEEKIETGNRDYEEEIEDEWRVIR